MSVGFFLEPRRLPRWSPWSNWLESGREGPLCLWTPRHSLKRSPGQQQQQQQEEAVARCAKRPCCRQERPAAGEPFRQTVSVAGFRPDQVHVRLSGDGLVTVSASHRERSADGFRHTRMVRRVNLPQHVRADRLTSRMTRDGQLVLEAPPMPRKKVMMIPVIETERHENTERTTMETQKTNKVEKSGKNTENDKENESAADEDVATTGADQVVPVEMSETEDTEVSKSHETVPEERADCADGEAAETTVQAANEVPEMVDLEAADVSDSCQPSPAAPAQSEESTSGPVSVLPTCEAAVGGAAVAAGPAVLASVDVSAFRPQEVSVRVSGRHISVEAVHEETAADGGSCQLRLSRRLALPEHVDPDLVTSRLTRAGQLVVEASPAQDAAPSA